MNTGAQLKPLLTGITVGTFLLGVFLCIIGSVFIVRGNVGETELRFFGQEFKSTNLGIGAIFLGLAFVVIMMRRVLASLDSLFRPRSSPVGDAPLPEGNDKASGRRGTPATVRYSRTNRSGRTAAGFPLSSLRSVAVIGETKHSLLEKCVSADKEFVRKRTRKDVTEVDALRDLIGHELVGRAGGLTVKLAVPLEVWEDESHTLELYPFFPGVRLDDVIVRNKYRPTGEFLGDFFVSTLRVVSALHGLGVLHRDVTPSNILITGPGQLILLDDSFAVREGSVQVPIENRGFAPAEQRRGEAVALSDLYSVAATAYFVGTGVVPGDEAPVSVLRGVGELRLGPDEDVLRGWMRGLLSPDVAAREAVNLVELGKRGTVVSELELLSILDLDEQGFLVLSGTEYAFVNRASIGTILADLNREEDIYQGVDAKGEPFFLRSAADPCLIEDIELCVSGKNPWRNHRG